MKVLEDTNKDTVIVELTREEFNTVKRITEKTPIRMKVIQHIKRPCSVVLVQEEDLFQLKCEKNVKVE